MAEDTRLRRSLAMRREGEEATEQKCGQHARNLGERLVRHWGYGVTAFGSGRTTESEEASCRTGPAGLAIGYCRGLWRIHG